MLEENNLAVYITAIIKSTLFVYVQKLSLK